MPLPTGARIGPYEVMVALGAGGMGQVYRARDTQLDRDVALKILPPVFAADPERLARFEREAKTLAVLNHPNIASIYGLEKSGATPALVMELVPGRTLDEIIAAGGPLSPDAAVQIAAQIADALEAAHEAGIVHRDLKPANIMIKDAWGPTSTHLPDGRLAPTRAAPDIAGCIVKLLDFGLARAMDSAGATAGAAADTTSSPTMLSPAAFDPSSGRPEHRRGAATQQGVILGTAGYMSPEQAKGRAVDKRADIWAFGVVLYQMLTGKPLFAGESVTEIIASVIKDAPDLGALPDGTPPVLRHLLARCLERDPKLRLRDIGEARILLQRVPELPGGSLDQSSKKKVSSRTVILAVAGALVLAAISAAVAWNARPESTVPVRRFELPAAMARVPYFAVSPDGSRIAYATEGHLYVRSLAAATTAHLGIVPPLTEGVFWSPDSRQIVYGTESSLRVVPAEGGPPFTIGKVPGSGRLTDGVWRDDGTIFFSVWRENLYSVPATGGPPSLVSAVNPDTEIDFHSVTPLPDGRLIVTTHTRGQDGARMDLVDGDRRTPLAADLDIDFVRFRPPNHLLFARVRTNPGTWIVPFDDGQVDLTRAVLVEPGAARLDASFEGTIVSSVPPKERRGLVWVSPTITTTGATTTSTSSVESVPGQPFESLTSAVAISPDGHRAVVAVRAANNQEEFLVRDLATGRDTRVPLPQASTGVPTGGLAAWTPAGRLLYSSGGVEALKIYDWPADGSSGGRPLVDGLFARMTPDGRELIFSRDERSHFRLYRAPILADGSAGEVTRVFPGANDPNARWFDLSPDGTLLAFTTRATDGQLNVFVATYPGLRERQQVTSNGGTQPRFSRDSRQLFYLSGTRTASTGLTRGELRGVSIATAPLSIGAPRVLVTAGDPSSGAPTHSGFDVARDGRLLMTQVLPTAPGDEARLVLLQNWPMAVRTAK